MKCTIRLPAEEYDKKYIEYIKNIKNKVLSGGMMKQKTNKKGITNKPK